MDGVRLADRLAYGAGCAARRAGFLHDAYRPARPAAALDLGNRFLRLCVAFVLPGGSVQGPSTFGVPFRQAWADWSYLRAGDYLAGPEGVVFVASIEPPKPMLVVMTNGCVALVRPAAPVAAGLNAYGGMQAGSESVLLEGFPASLLLGGVGERPKAGLPEDSRLPGYEALLPVLDGVSPRLGDVLIDERNARYTLTGLERTGQVWRLALEAAVS